MFRILSRLILLVSICYGGYQVYALQKVAKACELEVRNLEVSVNDLLPPSVTGVSILNVSYDEHYSLWLYHAPPGKAIEVQVQFRSSDQLETETLMRIPSRTKASYGTIELQFDVDTRPPMTRTRHLNVFGPEFRKAELRAKDTETFEAIRFVNQVHARDKFFGDGQASGLKGTTRSGLRILGGRIVEDFQQGSSSPKVIGLDQFVLCAFEEVDSTGAKILPVQKVVRAVAVDE